MKLIKLTLNTIAILLILMGVLATPIAIGVGLYDWAANDVLFKHAAWEGFKMWVFMILTGFVLGIPMFAVTK